MRSDRGSIAKTADKGSKAGKLKLELDRQTDHARCLQDTHGAQPETLFSLWLQLAELPVGSEQSSPSIHSGAC